MMLKSDEIRKYIEDFWEKEIIPEMMEYIKIPNKSPAFDSDWEKNGYMDDVLELVLKWIEKHKPDTLKVSVKKIEGRTPLIILDYPGTKDGNILMYGHLDKQPEMEGWRESTGPWTPLLENDKLYGRGGADDGYAVFAVMATILALRKFNLDHAGITGIIEFSEESGSPDLPAYLNEFENEIGKPDLVVCLDSGAGNYDQFWMTTSLRGLIGVSVRIDVLNEGVHSGGASGLVPSSFRILRQLLSRIEDEYTGKIKIDEFYTEIPEYRKEDMEDCVNVLGEEIISVFPWFESMEPSTQNLTEALKKLTWEPTLSVVGVSGAPDVDNAGNVLRPYTEVKLSLRLPPTVDSKSAQEKLKTILLDNPPYNAKITLDFEEPADGWSAPEMSEDLSNSVNDASVKWFGKPAVSMGEGGTIPFMAMLGEKYPAAQFVITGVLGPESNAHGPNEFLHIPFVKVLNCCIVDIVKNYKPNTG